MKTRYFENGLALLGALVILAGVGVAANISLAGDLGAIEIQGYAQN